MALSLPTNVFDLQGEEFFQLVQEKCGITMAQILRYLEVISADCLLGIPDLFAFFHQDSVDLLTMTKKVGIILTDGSFKVKEGLRFQADTFIQSLKVLQHHERYSETNQLTISSAFIDRYPIIRQIVKFFENDIPQPNNSRFAFTRTIIETIITNYNRANCRFSYTDSIREFAACLFILGGRNVYEFIRLNVSGLLPSLTTIQALIDTGTNHFQEGEFRYDAMCDYLSSNGSKLVFASEDCTSVIPKVTYDATSNSFIGFVPSLKNGLPEVNKFSTESFAELENWFSTIAKSHLLNVHMIQPIVSTSNTCSPFMLSAYGTDNCFKTQDIINRWTNMVNECLKKDIKLIGFATDADTRYLKAMRLLMGFFAHMPDQQFLQGDNTFRAAIPRVSSILNSNISYDMATVLLPSPGPGST